MSLETLKPKVAKLIEKAQSGGTEDKWQEDTSPVVYENTCYQNANISAYITENGTLTYKRNALEYKNHNPQWQFMNIMQLISALNSGAKNWANVRQAEVINVPEATGEYLITKLDNSAFAMCYNLRVVRIPNTITALGNSVFQECTKLKKIELPETVLSMGSSIFRSCSALEEFTIPPLVTQLSSYSFGSCFSLKSVNGLERMTSIGTNCFDGCIQLRGTLTFNDAISTISDNTFRCCASLEKVVFKGTPSTISANAFASCIGIKDVYVPWAEGAVAGAPWGATNATIHYNTTYDENHEPIIAEV